MTNKTIADLKSEIRKIKREKPDRKIILTGCAAQIHQEDFSKMSEIHAIIGNKEKLEEKTYERLRTANDKVNVVGDILQERQAIAPIIDKVEQRIRGFVQIQNGCDHRCTFCIIPYGRGNSRSVKPNNVVKQINEKLIVKSRNVTQKRLELCGIQKIKEIVIPNEENILCNKIQICINQNVDIILIIGPHAITHIKDVIPNAISMSGAKIIRFGIPVEPGNLLLLSKFKSSNKITFGWRVSKN
mgnify:CR=1 FL=1